MGTVKFDRIDWKRHSQWINKRASVIEGKIPAHTKKMILAHNPGKSKTSDLKHSWIQGFKLYHLNFQCLYQAWYVKTWARNLAPKSSPPVPSASQEMAPFRYHSGFRQKSLEGSKNADPSFSLTPTFNPFKIATIPTTTPNVPYNPSSFLIPQHLSKYYTIYQSVFV